MDIYKFIELIVCPTCRNRLSVRGTIYCCDICHLQYRFEKNKLIFLANQVNLEYDFLNQLKNNVKKFPRIYQFLAEFIAPVHISKKNLRKIIKEIESQDKIGLNIGSGVTNYSSKILNFDLQPFPNVEVIGDLFNLPFKDSSFDYVFSIFVLEHVPNPELAIEEMHRVLKPGGICYAFIPFIQGYHAAPNDYLRFTSKGVENYFYKFDILKNSGIGPTSGTLWILQEYLAILLSFNSKKIHFLIHTLIMVISFPIKYLDIILSKYYLSQNIASVNEVMVRKK